MAARPLLASLLSPLVAFGIGCFSPSGLTQVPIGRWGGDHVELVVGSASAQLDFDCAHGSIPGPIPLQDGAFDIAGVFVPEHGGPIVQGEVLPEYAAHYRGTTDGKRMTLTIEAEGLGNAGTYALDLGRSARITKCL